MPVYSSASSTFSNTVNSSIRLKLWKMKPIFPRRSAFSFASLQPATLRPSNQYSPDVGTSSSPRTDSSVDLPQPDGPVMATYSPAAISRSMRSRAVVRTSPAVWILLTPDSRSMSFFRG